MEKIKAKNAEVICALVNGETVQGRCLDNLMGCIMPKLMWVNLRLNFKSGFIDSDTLPNVLSIETVLTSKIYEFRIIHPHQDLIDQIEADPLLEEYLEVDTSTFVIPNPNRWEKASLEDLKFSVKVKESIGWRINKPAHPHQKLIDLHKANPDWIVQAKDSYFEWWPTKTPKWFPKDTYRIIRPEIIAESKGAKDE